jgi:predicted transcriptional regulator
MAKAKAKEKAKKGPGRPKGSGGRRYTNLALSTTAWKMRVEGYTYEEISKELGITVQAASMHVTRHVRYLDSPEQIRDILADRLQKIHKECNKKKLSTEKRLELQLKCIAMVAKLNALDVTRVDVTSNGNSIKTIELIRTVVPAENETVSTQETPSHDGSPRES